MQPGRHRVGRAPGVEFRLDDERVSRHHASLWVDEAGVEVEDHASRNGMKVNGVRVYRRVQLRSGDRLEIGGEEFELLLDDPSDREISAVPTAAIHVKPTPNERERLELLSPRERELIGLFAQGHSAREIGEKVGLGTKTVETYRGRIAQKLDLKSRPELIQFAVNAGLLKPEG